MVACSAAAGQGFHPQRKRRLLLGRFRALEGDPPFRPIPGGTGRGGGGTDAGAASFVSIYSAISALLRGLRAYSSPSEPKAHADIMKAILVKQHGGPEVMQVADIPKPSPGPKQALVKIEASGINYI